MRHQSVIILLCVAFALLINLASGCPYHDRIQYLKRQQNARIRKLMRRDGSASHSLYNGKLDTTLRNEYIQEDRTLLRQQNEIDRLNRFLLSINSKYADRGHTHTHSTSSSDNSPQESHTHNSPSPASGGHTGSSPRSEGHSHTPSRQRDRTSHARTKPNAVHSSTDHGTSTSSSSNSGRSRTPSRSGSRTATSGGHTTSLHRPPNRHYGGYNSHTGYVPGDRSTAGVTIGQAATVWKPEQYVACEGSRYHVCPLGTTCVVRFGTYRCARTVRYSCPEGFVRHNVSSTQFRCKDIDECDNVDLNTCDYVCR
uniref:Sushi domain-containing protein n=1 Tax=Ciona savignyi TaxID=51511 RepID=H2ZMZ2_CIOSA